MFETVYEVRVVYKSGYTHDFECTDFEMVDKNIIWSSASARNRPLKIGVDDVAAVWQIGHRKRFKKFW